MFYATQYEKLFLFAPFFPFLHLCFFVYRVTFIFIISEFPLLRLIIIFFLSFKMTFRAGPPSIWGKRYGANVLDLLVPTISSDEILQIFYFFVFLDFFQRQNRSIFFFRIHVGMRQFCFISNIIASSKLLCVKKPVFSAVLFIRIILLYFYTSVLLLIFCNIFVRIVHL